MIEAAHTSAGAATLARTVPLWGRFRSPREPTAGPCRGCLLPSATNTAPSRHHLQAVLCDGWDVQTPPSWLLRPQTRELCHLRSLRSQTPPSPPGRLRWHAQRRVCGSSISSTASSLLTPVGSVHSLGPTECTERASGASRQPALAAELPQTRKSFFLCDRLWST